MFSKTITHEFFGEVNRGLLGYSARIEFASYHDVELSIKGRSEETLNFAATELKCIEENLKSYLSEATEEMYGGYEAIKDSVDSEEFDLAAEGGELPDLKSPEEVWSHAKLESIRVEPKSEHQIRLGFREPWEIEHDFGIYISQRKFQYCGISV